MAVEALVADAEGPAVIVTGFKEISPLARVVVSLGCELAPVLGITSVQTAVVVPLHGADNATGPRVDAAAN